MKGFVYSLLISISITSYTQAQSDSLVLTYEQFLAQVYTQHPIAKQINIIRDKAEQVLKKSRGNFDPNLNGDWNYKHFKDNIYYSILNAHLNVPTWIGLEVEAGYNHTLGYKLNPENTLPSAGQAYLGLKMPLLKGLWTDERRTAIKQAKLLQESSEVDIKIALNNLLYEAAKAYWDWTKAANNLSVVNQSLTIAKKQLNVIRQSYRQGDKPAIDTLKAFIRVQDRLILLAETKLQTQNSLNSLSSFVWNEEQQPLNLPLSTKPISLEQLAVEQAELSLLENSLSQIQAHPNILYYDFKLRNLLIEQKLKKNKILPSLDLKYNFLSYEHVDFFHTAGAPIENYKLGIKLKMPLFLRKERADIKLNQLKIREVGYQQQTKQQELKIKIQNYFNTFQNYATQINQIEQMIENYNILLEAEQLKIGIGESSLFLINARENQLLEAQLKLIKQQVAYLKARTSFFWITVNLSEQMK